MTQCKRCIMDDSSDPYFHIEENGYCNYCNEAIEKMNQYYFPNCEDDTNLKHLIAKLKEEGKGKKYDCVMGISGGLDSSYLAYLGSKKWGLRILAFHVDDGYDTEISKRNIERLASLPNIDMDYIVPDAKQFNELTRAFFFAGVPNLAMPQDNILFAELYKRAKDYKIQSFLTGGNYSLESILQRGNSHRNTDEKNIKDIFKKYGRGSINKLHFISPFKLDLYYYFSHLTSYTPLNLMKYNREEAINELNREIGFEYYGSKHLENDLTKFIQLYWFPHKFNVDKRKSHYSSMIISNQMTREEALELMKKPLYDEEDMAKTIKMIKERLNISDEEFDEVMSSPAHQHDEFRISHYEERKENIKKFFHYSSKDMNK